ncbi:MAG TPA: hypothetical protein VFJ96_04190, partial [Gemmatimonadaceae bacterium]|nr:hypothetical protein [Gemmatimonadaceae bacterium]
GKWGGQIAITLREQGGRTRRFVADAPSAKVRFSITSPDLTIGASGVTLLPDGRYALTARAREVGTNTPLTLDLVVTPVPRDYFPGTTLASGRFTSGYTVPALRANATGTICVDGACEHYDNAQSYHDHNWGVWRGVTWEWGASRAGDFTFLYGRVQPPDSSASTTPFFFYLVDSLGFRALFRPHVIEYTDDRVITVDGHELHVPSRAVITDVRGDDTLRVELDIEDAIGTDTRRSLIERGDLSAARRLAHPYFIQMKGIARLSGRVGGAAISGVGRGFFETYR